MIDSMTRERIAIYNNGPETPYIMVPLDQLEAIESILDENQISYWVDSHAVSLNGKPEIVVINLGRAAISTQIQQLLDAAN